MLKVWKVSEYHILGLYALHIPSLAVVPVLSVMDLLLMCPKNVATLLPIDCGQIVTVAGNATVIVIATVGILRMARDARCAAAHRLSRTWS